MKFLVSQLSYFLSERQLRTNLGALLKYLLFLLAVITLYSVLFHFIMYVEDQNHSWVTGFYWTLTVMSTLGFGDITFHSDLGRLFSLVVLVSGIVLLLIMLPFTFIRYFYAPWLEAQIHLRAPRSIQRDLKGHVIICRYDTIARGLITKLEFNHIPYVVLEPDPAVAARMASDEISVVTGDIDSRLTYERLRVADSRMVFANAEDTTNTNVALTAREVDQEVPIVALAEEEGSVDILELSGATHVLLLKHKLGEHLAARVNLGGGAHVVGRFKDLLIAEFVANATTLIGKTIREARLRELTGVNIVGVWERGRLQPVRPEIQFSNFAVPVAIGSREQLDLLDDVLGRRNNQNHLVLVLGGGKVGRAAARSLKQRGVTVHLVEKERTLRSEFHGEADRLVVGDAAVKEVLVEAGLDEATAVVLTTNDDAVNIYLTVYCRRLKPDLNIVSRITREKNIEAIYRAGADSVLSYASLGREYVIALLLGREPILVGEGADYFQVTVPESLVGKTLGDSRIGARTGLIVIALEHDKQTVTNPSPVTRLPAGGRLLMLGTAEQRKVLSAEFG